MSLKFIHIMAFFALQIISSVKSGEQIYCDPTNRPIRCGWEREPVCGYFWYYYECDGCNFDFGSPCKACQSAQIEFYVPGECPPEDEGPTEEPPGPMDIDLSIDETPDEPIDVDTDTTGEGSSGLTTGTEEDNGTSNLPEDHTDTCSLDPKEFEINGEVILGTACCGGENESCEDLGPVCAYLSDCIGVSCHQTKSSGCDACSTGFVSFYVPGPCLDESLSGTEEVENDEEFYSEEEFYID